MSNGPRYLNEVDAGLKQSLEHMREAGREYEMVGNEAIIKAVIGDSAPLDVVAEKATGMNRKARRKQKALFRKAMKKRGD